MTYANFAGVATKDLHNVKKTTKRKGQAGIFRRFVEALMAARMRQAEREIAHYLAGRSFSDDFERDIIRLFHSLRLQRQVQNGARQ